MNFSAYDEEGRRKYINAAEGDRFLQATSLILPFNEAIFCKTLYFTGCRISECLMLGPSNLDFNENTLRIRTLKKRGKIHVRRIPIPQGLSRDLQKIESSSDQFWSFSRTTAWRDVKAVVMASGVKGPHACPKGLRHGFGVRAVLAGIPITKIQKWMGHSNIKTTAIYLDVRDAEERELMQRTWEEYY